MVKSSGRASLVVVLVLGAGCATIRQVPRAEAAAEFSRLAPERDGPVTVGVARRQGSVVFGSLVERQLVTDLNLTERLATWTDASTGASRTEPIEIISWIQWRPVGASKTFDLLLGAAVGLLVGAAGGMSATAILGRDTCVGGTALGRSGVGYFAERCFPGWTNQLPLWGAVGAAIGAFVGGVVGWAVGRETRLEFNDARVP